MENEDPLTRVDANAEKSVSQVSLTPVSDEEWVHAPEKDEDVPQSRVKYFAKPHRHTRQALTRFKLSSRDRSKPKNGFSAAATEKEAPSSHLRTLNCTSEGKFGVETEKRLSSQA